MVSRDLDARPSVREGAEAGWRRRLRHFDPALLLFLAAALVLIALVANPLLRLIWTSFQDAQTGDFTLANYATAYGRARYLGALWNSLLLGAGVSALDVVSTEMEDAANILGAGIWRTTLRVTLPLVLPSILGGVIVTFLEAIALFGSPALIAIPARFNVVTTQLWQFFENPVRVEVAAAYAMPLLGITVALFWLQQRITERKGFVALTGKGGERRPLRLGAFRWVLLRYSL